MDSAASPPLIEMARDILTAAIEAVNPGRLIRDRVRAVGSSFEFEGRPLDIEDHDGVDLLAFGKAAPEMAAAFADILGDRLRGGLVVGLPGRSFSRPPLTFLPAPHPLPDERSEAAGRAALDLAARAGSRRLVFVLASGGGSAQLCVPAPGIRRTEKTGLTAALMARGADIRELNTVRKHLSAIKGGRLAQAAYPARVINWLLSDVVGDDPEVIASGPAYWDSTSYLDAKCVLDRYDLWKEAPAAVRSLIEAGREGKVPETLKPNNPVFRTTETFLLGRNADALEGALRRAVQWGLDASIPGDSETGEARDAAVRAAAMFREACSATPRTDRPRCLIAGGEHTVTVRGRGRGGRNQEFVLAFLEAVAGFADASGRLGGRDWLVLSAGTDGIDGPTDAAGAWAGPVILRRSRALGLEPRAFLDDNDAYRFFQRTNGLIITGPTGTNVMDVRVSILD